MKKLKNILYAVMTLGLGACASEAPFSNEPDVNSSAEGRILTSSLDVKVRMAESMTRAEEDVNVDDFKIEFVRTSNKKVEKTYATYLSMPEVVTLPEGSYMVRASYGGMYSEECTTAAFETPYYLGNSESFQIVKDKIVDNLAPVVCKLSNVKVTILFDVNLVAAMDKDSKVVVEVGNSGPLTYKADENKAGYFACDAITTLTATFSGRIDGEEVTETKTMPQVSAGTHYRITFKLHKVDPNEPGNIIPGEEGNEIKVDASVNLEDMTGDGGTNIEPDDEFTLEDDRYGNEEPEKPIDPEDPGVDPTPGAGPTIESEGAKLGVDNYVSDMNQCLLIVKSETGIEKFTVVIDSDKLTPEELVGVNLTDELDLVTPGDYLAPLQNFGFLDKESDQQSLAGETDVTLDISPFLELLQMLGGGTHNFIITVGDATGEITKTLTLITEDEE